MSVDKQDIGAETLSARRKSRTARLDSWQATALVATIVAAIVAMSR